MRKVRGLSRCEPSARHTASPTRLAGDSPRVRMHVCLLECPVADVPPAGVRGVAGFAHHAVTSLCACTQHCAFWREFSAKHFVSAHVCDIGRVFLVRVDSQVVVF